ncbi:hypothetical protein [Pseudomonas sp. 37 R 15]|uniref:hypothetical protein n=1 Tax=Pseudomonas sp. 37 R 15 TaxID=1844104 RepID=UPI000811F0E4|nr:hypothetical protein [Pseudomonas sp. 37 R 15]CRM45566.1 hypothetical protein [Pseudomonas sp. 37 R 15]
MPAPFDHLRKADSSETTSDTALPPIIDTLPDIEGDDQRNVIRQYHSINGLPVEFPHWKNAATEPGYFDQVCVDIDDRRVHIEVFEGPIEGNKKILLRTPHLQVHGYKKFIYSVTPHATSQTSTCDPVVLFVDAMDPNYEKQPEAIILPDDLPNAEVTREYLDRHGGLTLEMPRPVDSRPRDTFDLRYDFGDDTGTTGSIPITGPIKVNYSKQQILDAGPGLKQITYSMTDRAGNQTLLSKTRFLNVTLA